MNSKPVCAAKTSVHNVLTDRCFPCSAEHDRTPRCDTHRSSSECRKRKISVRWPTCRFHPYMLGQGHALAFLLVRVRRSRVSAHVFLSFLHISPRQRTLAASAGTDAVNTGGALPKAIAPAGRAASDERNSILVSSIIALNAFVHVFFPRALLFLLRLELRLAAKTASTAARNGNIAPARR